MQVEDMVAGLRFRPRDANGRDSTQRLGDSFRPGGWIANPTLVSMDSLAPRRDTDAGLGAALYEEASAQPYQLGFQTHFDRYFRSTVTPGSRLRDAKPYAFEPRSASKNRARNSRLRPFRRNRDGRKCSLVHTG